jgi:hypothetical protein
MRRLSMHFGVVFSIVAILLLMPVVASAECSASVALPNFTVALKDPPVNYRMELDSASMAKIASENGMASLKGEIPFGLTIGRYDLEVTVDTDSIRSGNGYCAQLHAAHVEIGLKQLDVIVDRRFPVHSCQREAIIDHESQHVDVFREAVRYYLPTIERILAATSLPPIVQVDDRAAARDAYLAPITDALKPIFEAINGRARDGNTRLDAPESYAAVFRRCDRW